MKNWRRLRDQIAQEISCEEFLVVLHPPPPKLALPVEVAPPDWHQEADRQGLQKMFR